MGTDDKERSLMWSRLVRDRRKAAKMTRRKLAEQAQIDPSYVTLIERYGYVPSRACANRVALALPGNQDDLLLVAGYLPPSASPVRVAKALAVVDEQSLMPGLSKLIRDLANAPKRVQEQAIAVITALVGSTEEKAPRRRRANGGDIHE